MLLRRRSGGGARRRRGRRRGRKLCGEQTRLSRLSGWKPNALRALCGAPPPPPPPLALRQLRQQLRCALLPKLQLRGAQQQLPAPQGEGA